MSSVGQKPPIFPSITSLKFNVWNTFYYRLLFSNNLIRSTELWFYKFNFLRKLSNILCILSTHSYDSCVQSVKLHKKVNSNSCQYERSKTTVAYCCNKNRLVRPETAVTFFSFKPVAIKNAIDGFNLFLIYIWGFAFIWHRI